jgi:hypothetical protein
MLTLFVATMPCLGQDTIKCAECGFESPSANKFCNKCGAPVSKDVQYFLGPGAKGRITQVEKGRVIIAAGTADGVNRGDYFHTFETVEIVTSPTTGDTLDFRSRVNAVIKITEASPRASYGSYRVVGSCAPSVGDEIFPHHRTLQEKSWYFTWKFGRATPKEVFPIGQKEWPDWDWGDLTKTSPPDWAAAPSTGFQVERNVNEFLSLGADVSIFGFESLRPKYRIVSTGGFAKLQHHAGRATFFLKGMYSRYRGTYDVEIWFIDRDQHYPKTYNETYGGTLHELGGGVRLALSNWFGLILEYSKGKMTLEDVQYDELDGYVIPIFSDKSAEYSRLDLGIAFGF